ncbi:MAG TPA: hypothetical protein VF353_03400, partial [Candidatus Binatia bacterium]
MLKPKSLPFRRILIATLTIVALLLPALHFHPADEHRHGAEAAHRHGIVHADFFTVFDHQNSKNTNDHNTPNVFEVDSPKSNDQLDLVALTSPQLKLASKFSETVSVLLYYEEPIGLSLASPNSLFFKHDHPPPIQEYYPSLGS